MVKTMADMVSENMELKANLILSREETDEYRTKVHNPKDVDFDNWNFTHENKPFVEKINALVFDNKELFGYSVGEHKITLAVKKLKEVCALYRAHNKA
jgi:hypothetical protein